MNEQDSDDQRKTPDKRDSAPEKLPRDERDNQRDNQRAARPQPPADEVGDEGEERAGPQRRYRRDAEPLERVRERDRGLSQ